MRSHWIDEYKNDVIYCNQKHTVYAKQYQSCSGGSWMFFLLFVMNLLINPDTEGQLTQDGHFCLELLIHMPVKTHSVFVCFETQRGVKQHSLPEGKKNQTL